MGCTTYNVHTDKDEKFKVVFHAGQTIDGWVTIYIGGQEITVFITGEQWEQFIDSVAEARVVAKAERR